MFFILPVGVDYRAQRYPVVTFTIMGMCVLVYLVTLSLQIAYGQDVTYWVFENLWLTPNKSYWWTYITTLFVHDGFFHLAGNMIYLFLFGACVEDVIGRLRFSVFYLISGLAASFTYIAFSPGHFASEIPLGGASGAISACIGGFLLLMAKTKITFKWIIFLFFRFWNGEFMLPAWLVISFWFLQDLAMMILTMMAEEAGKGVAFAAHVGGSVFGMGLMAMEKIRLKKVSDEDWEPTPAPVVRVVARPRVVSIANETASIHLFNQGVQTGPFTPSQVQEMFFTGAISIETLYWHEGMDDWRKADELRETGMSNA